GDDFAARRFEVVVELLALEKLGAVADAMAGRAILSENHGELRPCDGTWTIARKACARGSEDEARAGPEELAPGWLYGNRSGHSTGAFRRGTGDTFCLPWP